ncbi:MAG: triose-phosphate isomerase [Flavobacteriales bacterium]
MRKKILAANWKMNLTQPEVNAWLETFHAFDWHSTKAEIRIYPSALYLKQIAKELEHAGAQNVFHEAAGAYTGEISIEQLQNINVRSALIGHSERRQIFQEDNAQITLKVQACAQAAFPFILCCGEPLSIREARAQQDYVIGQLRANLQNLNAEQLNLLVVAYEPIWAIGSGASASLAQISEMHRAIRQFLVEQFDDAGEAVPILYGGSVSTDNARTIFSCPVVDGALVGGAALDAHTFYQLWQALNA